MIEQLQSLAIKCTDKEDVQLLNKVIRIIKKLESNNKLLTIKKQLDELDKEDEDYEAKYELITKDLEWPQDEWIPCTILDMLNKLANHIHCDDKNISFVVDREILNKPIHVYEDDGSGYGAYNAYAFDTYLTDKELQLWI